MNLELSDYETELLETELRHLIDDDRYPLSPRILALKGILNKIKPEPIPKSRPPVKIYEPPSKGRFARRR
jgi:hypothetical protein